MKGNWTVIPDISNMDEYMTLVSEYGVAFEYNDFFDPSVYEDKNETERRIAKYLEYDRDRSKDTLHGVFYDIAPISQDSVIRDHCRMLMRQSMDIAEELGCKGVVFHTGLLAGLNTEGYLSGWLSGMTAFLHELAAKYRGLYIYMENTFENSPVIFNALMDNLKDEPNVALCLDYAHAALTSTPAREWFEEMAPYIKHMHLNDNDLISDLHLAAGDGNIDYSELEPLIEKYGVQTQILLEVNGIEKARRSLEYMTAL